MTSYCKRDIMLLFMTWFTSDSENLIKFRSSQNHRRCSPGCPCRQQKKYLRLMIIRTLTPLPLLPAQSPATTTHPILPTIPTHWPAPYPTHPYPLPTQTPATSTHPHFHYPHLLDHLHLHIFLRTNEHLSVVVCMFCPGAKDRWSYFFILYIYCILSRSGPLKTPCFRLTWCEMNSKVARHLKRNFHSRISCRVFITNR